MHDLFESWERAGAGDLEAFTSNWLRTAGPDTITLDRAAGVVRRTPPAEHPADRSHTIRLAVATGGAWEDRTIVIEGPETPLEVPADAAVVIDPYDDSWVAAVPDQVSVAALKELLPEITDGELRAGVWNNVRTGAYNAAIDPADLIDLVAASLPIEDTEDSRRRTLAWVFGWVVALGPADALDRVHDAALGKLTSNEPGNELQLAAFRTAISAATSADALRVWLVVPPEGIEIDADLRWRVLVRLATLGATDRDELQAALDAEPTAVARVEHTKAVASLPDAEAKAWAWDRFTGKVDVPNYELEAAGIGMWRGGQDALLEEYVDRYFTDLPATVAVRSGWVLADAAEFFFPVTSLTEETLARTRSLAEDETLDLSIRRRLVDQPDELRRKLALRKAFPQS
jgi:aminopeptidase N